jgi:hypothetical protein
MKKAVENLEEKDALVLLSALFKKSEANAATAYLCNIVKYCLLILSIIVYTFFSKIFSYAPPRGVKPQAIDVV